MDFHPPCLYLKKKKKVGLQQLCVIFTFLLKYCFSFHHILLLWAAVSLQQENPWCTTSDFSKVHPVFKESKSKYHRCIFSLHMLKCKKKTVLLWSPHNFGKNIVSGDVWEAEVFRHSAYVFTDLSFEEKTLLTLVSLWTDFKQLATAFYK